MSRSVGRRSPRILNCAPMGSRNTVRFSIANGPAACITIHSCASLNAIGIVDLINESFAHSVTDLINFIGLGYELQGCRRGALPKRATVEETNWEKWAGEPRPGDAAGAYSYEQLLRMDGDFTAALERAFAAGLESPLSARRIYAAKG